MDENQILLEEKKFTTLDMINFLQQNAKLYKRTWNKMDVNIKVYIYLHKNGVVFLYSNYTDNVFEENISFDL